MTSTGKALALAIFLVIPLAVVEAHINGSGTEFIEGSGWVLKSGQKVHFGVAAVCKDGQYDGHFQFKDKSLGWRMKDAEIVSVSPDGDQGRLIEGFGVVEGISALPGSTGEETGFRISVYDYDHPGKNTDIFRLELDNGYVVQDSLLGGGEIRLHRHPGGGGCASTSPDTTPPEVTISAPANGATVSGTVSVTADASDDVGVVGVRFLVDGEPIGAEDDTAPYSAAWDSTTVADGEHTLTAVARDAAGNTASAGINVLVDNDTAGDTTEPVVSITSPEQGSTVSGTVTVSANASDDTAVARVRFRLVSNDDPSRFPACANDVALGEDDTAPYAVSWDTTSVNDCSYLIYATAEDGAGNTATDAVGVTTHNDTEPPQVSIVEPADGAVVSGATTIRADASDNVTVARIDFRLDDTIIHSSSQSEFSWNSTSVPDATYALTATAYDGSGNSTTSAPVSITVDNQADEDTTPPAVELTEPADGATVSGILQVAAQASDDTAVAGVQFRVDGVDIGPEDTSAPYSVSWNSSSVSDGSHTLTAVARDVAGNTAASSVTVTVSNDGGGTVTRVEQDDPAVDYAGNWLVISDSRASGGTATESREAGATVTMNFTGTGVTWIGFRCSCAAGIVNLYVNGTYVDTLDTNGPDQPEQAEIYSVSGLPDGDHTFTIEVTGEYNRDGNTAYVIVDAFDVTQ